LNVPKIISLGFAVPPFQYTQEDIFHELDYPRHFWRLFKESLIENRHFCVPLGMIRNLSFQEQQDIYLREAVKLAEQAIFKCLDGEDPAGIGCLTYASCTGIAPGPTIGHELAYRLKMKDDLVITNITAHGCEGGGFPGLKRAADYTAATGRKSLIVATELCSLTHFPEPNGPDRENGYELMRANAVFADAASAALIGMDGDWRHPSILSGRVFTDFALKDKLGYVWRDGRLRVKLSKDVPDHAANVASEAVLRLLAEKSLMPDEIQRWIVHGAGMSVLDKIQERMHLDEHALDFSRAALRTYGNVSSATVGIVGKLMVDAGVPKRGDLGLAVTVGPGMTGGASLLGWGVNAIDRR
jgi:predicted naringenin-chalcone synthase